MPTRTLVTWAAAAVAALAFAVPAAAATPPDPVDAGYGAGWVAGQLIASDGVLSVNGSPDIASTAYAVLDLHATGDGRQAGVDALNYLRFHLAGSLHNPDGTDNPGLLSYVILAVVASGEDPSHFGSSSGGRNNLTARLLATERTTGSDAGLFGSEDPTYDGAFRQGVALAALAAAKVPAATVRAPIAWLEGQQCANGLWTSYRPDTGTACPAADPDTFAGPDTNSTGMAAQGLGAFGRHPHHTKLVQSLKAVRSADGGFPYLAAPGQASDPDSTALSIQALLSEQADPGTAYRALDTFQLGCADPKRDRGAYFFPGSRTPNVFATVQAIPAAAGLTLPLPASTLSKAAPTTPCAAAAPARSGSKGACAGSSGVTVSVDFTAFVGREQTRCAAGTQTSGTAASQSAGFALTGTAQYGLAFVCRIQDLPKPAKQSCKHTPPADAYWAFYTASATATAWSYSSVGASGYAPPAGSLEAWAFGADAQPSLTPAQVRAATR